MSADRSLVTIVFSDAVDFSKLTGENEELALRLIESDFQLFRDIVEAHKGEVIKSTGDGLLITFGSAVVGMQACLEMLRALRARTGQPLLQHRFGIHVGDIVRTADDVVGDGVNIAARLQSEAPAGGIALSRTVYDVVAGKTNVPAIRVGEKQLKNINKPVEMWHVMPQDLDAVAAPTTVRLLNARPLLIAMLLLIAGSTIAWQINRRSEQQRKMPLNASASQVEELVLQEVKQGVMREGPNVGDPCLEVLVSKDSSIPAGVQPYHLKVTLGLPDGTNHNYEVSAMISFSNLKDERVQIPLALIRPAGIPTGTKGVAELTIAERKAAQPFSLEGFSGER